MSGSKSSTCFGKKSRQPLTEYYSEQDAKESANYIFSLKGLKLTPYKCDLCGMWHLAPIDRHTPSRKCFSCKGSNGKYKELYSSQKDAEQRAKIILKEQGVLLEVYQCPFSPGWHLTKR